METNTNSYGDSNESNEAGRITSVDINGLPKLPQNYSINVQAVC